MTVCLNQTIENILLVAVGNNIQETILDTLSEHKKRLKRNLFLGQNMINSKTKNNKFVLINSVLFILFVFGSQLF